MFQDMDKNEMIIVNELNDEYAIASASCHITKEPFDAKEFTNDFVDYMKESFPDIYSEYNIRSYVKDYLKNIEDDKFIDISED